MNGVVLFATSHKIGLVVVDSYCIHWCFVFIQSCYQCSLRFKMLNASLLSALQLTLMRLSDFNLDEFVLFELVKLV